MIEPGIEVGAFIVPSWGEASRIDESARSPQGSGYVKVSNDPFHHVLDNGVTLGAYAS